jgi:hypothetical protein
MELPHANNFAIHLLLHSHIQYLSKAHKVARKDTNLVNSRGSVNKELNEKRNNKTHHKAKEPPVEELLCL